ncbi:MAG: hypothetical protein V3U98_09880 [Acidobacteriota bacterium]
MNAGPQDSRPGLPVLAWVALGAAAELGYLLWAWPPGGHLSYSTRLLLYLFLFAPAVVVASRLRARPAGGADLRWALLLAALFRLTLLPSAPVLSDDAYRYVWDGRVQLHGINPFRYAPDDPALEHLRDSNHALINHPEVPTIYPPLSQALFAVAALFSAGVLGVKTLLVLVEMGTWLALVRIWRLRGLSLAGLVSYLWNPLVIVEGSGSGHNDILGVGLLVCSSLLIILARPALSMTALSASVAAKFFPVLALPVWMRAVPKRFWALPPLVWLLLWAPYLGAGSRLWEGLLTYGRHWESNAFLFQFLRQAIAWSDLKPVLDRLWGDLCATAGAPGWSGAVWAYTEPRQIAKMIVAAGIGVALVWLLRSRAEPSWATFRLIGLALLFAPTLHPWYLMWVLPFAAWYGRRSWFVFSASVFLAYAPEGWGGLPEWVILWLEYVPFLAVLVFEEWRFPGAGMAHLRKSKLLNKWKFKDERE